MSETKVRTFYPSRLDAWTECPRRYRFRYVDTPPPPRRGAFAHTSLGAATHVALARWWSLADHERTGERVAAEVDAGWSDEGFADAAMSEKWRQRARAMVATYVEAETERRRVLEGRGLGEPRRVETSVTMRYDDTLALAGRPDRIDERPAAGGGSELVVVDYKTSRRTPTEHDARTSRTLAIYAAAAEAMLRLSSLRVELHHLPTGSISVWRHDRDSRDRQVRRAAAVAGDCRTAEDALSEGGDADTLFPARPGKLCVWCDYQASCAEGLAIGPPVEPWAGLEPAAESDVSPSPG